MPSVTESLQGQSPISTPLKNGLNVLSQDQTITFVKYVKVVLPLDGFVFWVKADMLNSGALFNTSVFNVTEFNQTGASAAANTVSVKGSLHYSISQRQGEDEIFAYNRVIFTAEQEIQDLNEVNPSTLYLGSFNNIRFAFSERGKFYKSADLYHYVGDAVYPAMNSVIIDNAGQLNTRELVVSNSLPFWLSLNRFCPVYPSYAIPDNISPPYISLHIPPESTRALQGAPCIDADTGSHWQLVADTARATIYGLRNNLALDWLDYVYDYLTNAGTMGLMNVPIPQDDKRSQNEMSTLAIKKTVIFEVSYYQTRMRELALQYIKSCIPSFIVQ